jgi:DNA-binding transcriptional regulator YdaS (Cro superfamily)
MKTLLKAIKRAGSQSALAAELGFSRQFINQLVKGERPIPAHILIKLTELI